MKSQGRKESQKVLVVKQIFTATEVINEKCILRNKLKKIEKSKLPIKIFVQRQGKVIRDVRKGKHLEKNYHIQVSMIETR